MVTDTPPRNRADLCPGVLRPWPADDGFLVRLRLIGGRLPVKSLRRLLQVSEEFGDGQVHLTKRANLQLRGLANDNGHIASAAVAAFESTDLLPSRTHELVRNVLVSPQTGIAGGRANFRPVAQCLDAALRADPYLSRLPGRFLFTLDDGRGDLINRLTGHGRRGTDLGLVALTNREAQLRVGDHWGEIVRLDEAALHLSGLAAAFLRTRGGGASAPWHLRELTAPLRNPVAPDPRLPTAAQALPYGSVPGGTHVEVPAGVLTTVRARRLLDEINGSSTEVVVTPWHGILIPGTAEETS